MNRAVQYLRRLSQDPPNRTNKESITLEHSNLEYHINNLNLYLYVFGLFSIFVIKPIQPDCDKIKGISVLLLETPLTRSKYFSPYTHAQQRTRTSRTFYTFAVTKPLKYPSTCMATGAISPHTSFTAGKLTQTCSTCLHRDIDFMKKAFSQSHFIIIKIEGQLN